MAGAQENGKREQFSMQTNGFSRDLLTKFRSGDHFSWKFSHAAESVDKEDEEVEIELSLGLSSNGRFGVDPKRANQKIVRSSSIASFMMPSGGGDGDESKENHTRIGPVVGHAPLMRASSLPTAAEEEWRKRKEMQTLRRMEAKRKRMERKNVVRAVRERVDVVENGNNGSSVIIGHAQGQNGNGVASSQGSLGSQGTGSSGVSDLESQPNQGTSKTTEERSPSSVQSQPEQFEYGKIVTQKFNGAAGEKEVKNTKDLLRNAMLDMPCVSTRGDGPNGKKIEGFLYRYQKGEEVKIVCVCHGGFFTPAEFVKHAGGSDVAHPLRHIVVDPSPLL